MTYPALGVTGADPELLLAVTDECAPTALEDRGDEVRIFFATSAQRDRARRLIAESFPDARLETLDVDDEDWARRSQANLEPVTVGRLTIVPARTFLAAAGTTPSLSLVVIPSTGFGTGHHATTRLCLAALQSLDLTGKRVIDIGTGSGVLALAARALGADSADGYDHDPDAVRAAVENLDVNPTLDRVRFDTIDLAVAPPARADVVTANLTGALLVRSAAAIRRQAADRGLLILSGILAAERNEVIEAFEPAEVVWEAEELGWVGLLLAPRAD